MMATVKTENVLRGSARNIRQVWDRASDSRKLAGADWYREAREIGRSIDRAFNLKRNSGAGIIAALSPSMGWEINVSEAWALAATGWSRRQSRANNEKALRIKNGENPRDVLGGNKVKAFYACIIDSSDKRACIDRHAVSVYMGRHVTDAEQKGLARVGVYERIANAYQRVADDLNVPVEVVQAVTWVQWRAEKGLE